jgi:hypothetical protein
MSELEISRLREPELVFADGKKAKDPRGGLLE